MRRASLFLLVLLSATACQKVLGFEDFEEGTTASGGAPGGGGVAGTVTGGTAGVATGGGGAGTGGTAGAAPCTDPSLPDTNMVGLRRPGDGKCVWIDPLEVTREQYQEYVTADPARPSICTWNTDLATPEASQGSPACKTSAQADAGVDAGTDGSAPDPKLPMTCVDWCDAVGFCTWKGKQLCHGDKILTKDPNQSAWYLACAGDAGQREWPYGQIHQTNICNDDCSGCELTPVGSKTGCTSPEGVFDLTGNAGEWVDECTGTLETDSCNVRGGNVHDDSTGASCSTLVSQPKKNGLAFVGFRCCWEPT